MVQIYGISSFVHIINRLQKSQWQMTCSWDCVWQLTQFHAAGPTCVLGWFCSMHVYAEFLG